ncbi:hypothetical protein V8F33_006927, partial [Rhypophila sp. PSN 637]
PLMINEMNIALAFTPGQDLETEMQYLPNNIELEEWVDYNYSFFVQVYQDKLQFIHQTAKEFLLATTADEAFQAPRQHNALRIAEAHQIARDLCFRFLAEKTKIW